MANKSWFPSWGDRGRDVEHFRGFKTQIDSLFEDWFGRSMGGFLAPRIDIAEDDRSITLTAELPGVNESDIDVSLVGDQLYDQGREALRARGQEGRARLLLAPHGALLRDIPTHHHGDADLLISILRPCCCRSASAGTVPYRVDPELVAGQLKDGALRIALPKQRRRSREDPRPRRSPQTASSATTHRGGSPR